MFGKGSLYKYIWFDLIQNHRCKIECPIHSPDHVFLPAVKVNTSINVCGNKPFVGLSIEKFNNLWVGSLPFK